MADPARDQPAERRKSSPLQAPGHADAGQMAQKQPEVAGGRVDEQSLPNILTAAHHTRRSPGLAQMGERPLNPLAPLPQQTQTPRAADAAEIGNPLARIMHQGPDPGRDTRASVW